MFVVFIVQFKGVLVFGPLASVFSVCLGLAATRFCSKEFTALGLLSSVCIKRLMFLSSQC